MSSKITEAISYSFWYSSCLYTLLSYRSKRKILLSLFIPNDSLTIAENAETKCD